MLTSISCGVDQALSVFFGKMSRNIFEEQGRDLHGVHMHIALFFDVMRKFFKTPQRFIGERHQPALLPRGIRGPTAAEGHSETLLYLVNKLHYSEVSPADFDFAFSDCPQTFGNLIHVNLRFLNRSFLAEV